MSVAITWSPCFAAGCPTRSPSVDVDRGALELGRPPGLDAQIALRLQRQLVALQLQVALADELDRPVAGDLERRLAAVDLELHDGVVVPHLEGKPLAELEHDLARAVARELEVNGVVVPCSQREMNDGLAGIALGRTILVIVEATRDHGRVQIAADELDEDELVGGGDADAPDAIRGHGDVLEDDARVPQDDRARVVVLVGRARVRMDVLDDRELCGSDASELFLNDALDALVERERHNRPPGRPPGAAPPALLNTTSVVKPPRFEKRCCSSRARNGPFSSGSGAAAIWIVLPTVTAGAPGTSARPVTSVSPAAASRPLAAASAPARDRSAPSASSRSGEPLPAVA